MTPLGWWVAFGGLIVAALAVDLGVFNRRAHAPSLREALVWSAVWIGLALLFNVGIYLWQGHEQALLFLTGYLVEESLSVDNLFVFLVIFNYFRVPDPDRPRLLFWGVLGAILFRVIFIVAGVVLIHRFHWISYLFGAFLVYTGANLARAGDRDVQPNRNPVIRWFRRLWPATETYHAGRYFVREAGHRVATPLFIAFLMLPTTDILFAVDSIPAVLAITTDPFIVITSNIFAVLGLRALFFVLAGLMRRFHYLNYGLAVILVLIGGKMLLSAWVTIPALAALAAVVVVLGLAMIASWLWPRHPRPAGPPA